MSVITSKKRTRISAVCEGQPARRTLFFTETLNIKLEASGDISDWNSMKTAPLTTKLILYEDDTDY